MTSSDRIDELARRLKDANRPFVIATVVRTEDLTSAKPGAKALVGDQGNIEGWVGGGCVQPAVRQAARQAIDDGRARLIRIRPGKVKSNESGIEEYEAHCHSGGTLDIFIEPKLPRPTLIVLGASPIGQVLARLSRDVGYSVTAACSTEDASSYEGLDRLIEGFNIDDAVDRNSSIIVATQGRGDRDALEAALRTDAGYVGFVASRRKAAKVRQQLLDSGFDAARVNAIRAPVGLDISAVTAEEVAVSILGELIQVRRSLFPSAEAVVLEDDENEISIEVVSQASCGEPNIA